MEAPPLASTPAEPVVPPPASGDAAPPVLDLTLPSPPRHEFPSLAVPPGPPDLLEIVQLPGAADPFPGHAAPPFGGTPPESRGRVATTPEPAAGLLLLLGLVGMGRFRRARG